ARRDRRGTGCARFHPLGSGGGSGMTAARRYVDPHDNWVDDVAVDLACRGKDIRRNLSRAEQRLATRLLLERGHGVNDVARVLHISGSNASRLVRETKTDPKDNR